MHDILVIAAIVIVVLCFFKMTKGNGDPPL
jgi:hypothetical protein